MRALLFLTSVAVLQLCSDDEPATSVPAVAIAAEHGGTVLRAEDHWVEVVPRSDGTIEAYVMDARGEPVPVAGTVATARVQGSDGRPRSVSLRWNADVYRFEGHLEDAAIVDGPIEVVVVVAGRPRRAESPRVVVVAMPDPAPPAVLVTPRERPAAVVVDRPRPPEVVVIGSAPPPSVVILGPDPPPPPGIVIVPPHPGVTVELDHHHGRGRGRHRKHRRHHDWDDDHDEDFDE
jgi:hypothetical protein